MPWCRKCRRLARRVRGLQAYSLSHDDLRGQLDEIESSLIAAWNAVGGRHDNTDRPREQDIAETVIAHELRHQLLGIHRACLRTGRSRSDTQAGNGERGAMRVGSRNRTTRRNRAKWVSTDGKRHREFCDFGEPTTLLSRKQSQ